MSCSRLCYVGLGSNVGDSLRLVNRAVQALGSLDGVRLRRTSSLFKTCPKYVVDQPQFFNAVAEVQLSPTRACDVHGLLADLKRIEAELGRVPGVRRGPRAVDLDIVAVEEQVLEQEGGTYPFRIPHPLMHERDFVLAPMAELTPGWRHPVLDGKPTVASLLRALPATGTPGSGVSASAPPAPVRVVPASGGCIGGAGDSPARCFERGQRTLIMGILNVTPDSFSDGGHYNGAVEEAVEHALSMVEEGATVIDVGGESTRPGAQEVTAETEIGRVVPVITELRQRNAQVTISVDTRKASVARAAVEAGADWVNDVSGGRFDCEMLRTVADLMVPIVLTHSRGTPETMNSMINYENIVADVVEDLRRMRSDAESVGVPLWNIILDPGLGFAKKADENLALLRGGSELVANLWPSPVLIGASRKKFVGALVGEPSPHRRAFGDAAVAAAAVAAGADFLRVHEVRAQMQATAVSDAIFRNRRAAL